MRLSMQSNPDAGVLLINFDDEGREHLLRDIENALQEQDHEFEVLDSALTPEEPLGTGWTQNDFYNIICKSEADAPLHVDCSVAISGGTNALRELCNRIRALPSECRVFELQAEPTAVHRKRPRISWIIGGFLSLLFLIPAADRLFVSRFGASDDEWFQMWCCITIAAAVLPMPRLISLRAMWSARLNAGLALLCIILLLVLKLGFFGSPAGWLFIPDSLIHILLYTFSGIFTFTAVAAFCRRGLRRTTSKEAANLRRYGRIVLVLGTLAITSIILLLGAVMHGLSYLEATENPSAWHYAINAALLISFCSQPVWILAEVLHIKKLCYLLTALTLIPGLLISAPIYAIELHLLGSDDLTLRILVSLGIIGLASGLFFYFRSRLRTKRNTERP